MKKTISITIVLGLCLCVDLSSQSAGGAWELGPQFTGAQSNDQFGGAIAIGPDMDGDGYPEMAVGLLDHRDYLNRTVGAIWLLSGRTGQVLWSYEPAYVFEGAGVGEELSFVPDLTGDGVVDVVCGSERALSWRGKLIILSGVDGSLVREHQGATGYVSGVGQQLGHKIVGLPDMDGDGFGDYVYSADRSDGPGGLEFVGRVECRSGQSGQLLWQTYGFNDTDHFGFALCQGPDLNGDGISEIVASSARAAVGGSTNPMGTVYCLDGVSGQIIRIYTPPLFLVSQGFGSSVVLVSDLDGDSIEDIVVGVANMTTSQGVATGNVTVISGQTGALIWGADGTRPYGAMGTRVFNIGDLNQDGFEDIATNNLFYPGSTVPLLSGRDGSLLWTMESQGSLFGGFGIAVGAFDRTGDGIPELFIGESFGTSGIGVSMDGLLNVLSFRPYLYRESSALSVSVASPLKLRLDFPNSEAGQSFAVLASAAGNLSTSIRGLEVPLIVDSYFWQTVQAPPASFRGTLDGKGDGVVNVMVPPSRVAPLVGSTLYFAAVTFGGGQLRVSSVAVPVEIVP